MSTREWAPLTIAHDIGGNKFMVELGYEPGDRPTYKEVGDLVDGIDADHAAALEREQIAKRFDRARGPMFETYAEIAQAIRAGSHWQEG